MKAKGKIDFAAIDRPDGERVVRITVTAGGVIKHTFELTPLEFRKEMVDLEKSFEALDDVKEAAAPKTPKPPKPVDPAGIPEKPQGEPGVVVGAPEVPPPVAPAPPSEPSPAS